jgi:hypothetical protein
MDVKEMKCECVDWNLSGQGLGSGSFEHGNEIPQKPAEQLTFI